MHDTVAIRRAHPIVETVAGAGIELRRAGRRYVARCPFHREAEPSFTVYPETASWYCFGCEAGGDVIDFVGRLRGTGFKDTAEVLAQGLAPLPANLTPLSSRRPPRTLSGDELAIIEATVSYYQRTLETYSDVRAYLTRRGVSLETARALRLGYAASGLADHLHRSGFDLALAAGLGLMRGGRERFVGRIVIPDLDRGTRATWLTGRAVLRQRLRYLSLDAPAPLLGLAQAGEMGANAVVVVEGPFDWLVACEWGIPAVALLGTHMKAQAFRALAGFARVYLALDADGPGRRAAQAIASDLGERAAIVTLPPGTHDLNELGQLEDGRNAFLRTLAEARERKEERWQPSDRTHDRAA